MNANLKWVALVSPNFVLIRLSILFACLCNSSVEAQSNSSEDEDSLEERARVCSIFGVLTANAEAIKQGDVLFLERNFYDGFKHYAPTQDGTLDEFRLVRVVFDDEQGKFLVLSRTISEWLTLGDCLGSAGNGISFVGLTEKSNEAWLRFELGLSHCG